MYYAGTSKAKSAEFADVLCEQIEMVDAFVSKQVRSCHHNNMLFEGRPAGRQAKNRTKIALKIP